MAKNSVQNIVSKLPVDTELVKYNVGSDGKISAVDVLPITNVVQNDNIAVNILIQAILGCFGIDMPTIATGVATGTHILADMMNLLANAKWNETEITVGDKTMSATEYIKKTFGIYSTSDFVNNLFTRLSDITFESESQQDSNIIAFDNEAYQMIKVIARCFGANADFTKLPVGDEQIINIPLDLENVNATFTYIGNMLIDKGYVAESLRDNFTISDWMQFALQPVTGATGNAFTNNVGFNNNGEFKYLHCYVIESIINTSTKVWTPVLFATKKEIKPIVFEQTSVNYNNLNGYVGYKAHLYDKTTGAEDMTKAYMVWYGRNHGNDSGSSYQNIWYDMGTYTQIWSDNELINGCDETYNVYYNGGLGNGNSVARNELGTYVAFPIRRWNSVYVSSDFAEIFVNNQHIGNYEIPAPAIDTTITDDIDKIDILPINGIFPIIIDWSSVQWIVTPNKTYEDTTTAVKTKLIDISEGVTLDEGIPINDIMEDYEYIYNPYFQSTIDYTGTNGDIFTLLPTEICGVFKGLCEANNFNDVCWDTNFWDSLKGLISDIAKPSDFISKLFALPFSLGGDVEYSNQTNPLIIGGQTFSNARIHKLIKGYKIIKSSHVFIGEETVSEHGQKKSVKRGTFLDFEPYSNATIYIPFVGDVDIPLNLIMYRYVYLEYTVALISGDFVVTLYSYNYNDKFSSSDEYVSPDKRYKKAYPVVTCTGNMALEFPVCGREYGNTSGTVMSIVGGAAAVASGGSTAVAGAIAGGIGAMSNAKPGAFTRSGQMNGILGYLTNWTPYITIFTHEQIAGFNYPVKDSAFNHSIGQRTERGIAIKHMDAGFHKVKGVKLENLKCTNSEKDEIYKILTEGFYTANRVPQPTP